MTSNKHVGCRSGMSGMSGASSNCVGLEIGQLKCRQYSVSVWRRTALRHIPENPISPDKNNNQQYCFLNLCSWRSLRFLHSWIDTRVVTVKHILLLHYNNKSVYFLLYCVCLCNVYLLCIYSTTLCVYTILWVYTILFNFANVFLCVYSVYVYT